MALHSAKRQRENKKYAQVGKVYLEVGEACDFIESLVFYTVPLRGFAEHHGYSHVTRHTGKRDPRETSSKTKTFKSAGHFCRKKEQHNGKNVKSCQGKGRLGNSARSACQVIPSAVASQTRRKPTENRDVQMTKDGHKSLACTSRDKVEKGTERRPN